MSKQSKKQNEKVQNVELEELKENTSNDSKTAVVSDKRLDLIQNVNVKIKAVLGDCELTVNEFFNLKEDSVIKLDQNSNTPIKVLLDEKLVATGNLVVVDDNFGVQITEVIQE